MFKKIKKFSPILFIIVIGIIPLAPLFQTGLPLTHDGQDHVARIANFYLSLQEGIIVPRWGANLNWGYGHPILMFLYPLSSYIASIFHFLGFSLIDSVKIVFGLTFIISGIGMYLWINRLLGLYAGVIAAILYMFAPYRFVNLYVRGAIGEHVSFAFIPFILFFITKLFLDKKITKIGFVTNAIGISIFTALLILSHNALSILFLTFAGFYTIILFFKDKNLKKLAATFISVVYGFSLSAFFWLPAYIEGKYTLRDIVTGGSEYADRFVVSPLNFLLPSWSFGITGQLSVQIGIVHIALIFLGVFVVIKLNTKKSLEKRIFILTLIFFLLSLFMMIKESNFIWSSISTLQKFQFPWRFLSLTVLTSSILGAYALATIKDKRISIFAIGGLVVLIVIFYSSYWRPNGYLIKSESFYKKVYYSTTDTGESSPIWSVRFMEQEASSPVEILSGNASIQEVFRSSIRHEYVVDAQERTRIKENTLYFPGWSVYVNEKKLPISEIEFQDPANRGVMTFFVEEGISKIEVAFEDTRVRVLSNFMSLISFIMVFPFIFLIIKKPKW
jgi:hypothetical protein